MADDAGALLVRSGLVSASALEDARARVASQGGTLGEQLVIAEALTDDQLTDFYCTRLLVPQVNPNALARLTPKIVSTIPSDMVIELRAIPVSFDADSNLTVAMSDPSDRHAVDEIAFFTGVYVVRAVATQMQIAWCLAHYYGHVTPLGQRLVRPSDRDSPMKAAVIAAAQRIPRTKGLTGKVNAARHRAVAPVTGPVDVVRPNSGELDLRAPVPPTVVPAATPPSTPTIPGTPGALATTTLPGVGGISFVPGSAASLPDRPAPALPRSLVGADALAGAIGVVPRASADAPTLPPINTPVASTAKAAATERLADTSDGADLAPDGAPDKLRTRSVSGEIRVPIRRAPSIRPPLPEPDEDDEPLITIEKGATDDDATGRRKLPPLRRRVVKSDPPELRARAGEVDLKDSEDRAIDADEPRIVIDEDALAPPTAPIDTRAARAARETPPPLSTIDVVDDAERGALIHDRIDRGTGRAQAHERESQPILLERPRATPDHLESTRATSPDVPSDDDDEDTGEIVVMLDATNQKHRPERHTQVGVPPAPIPVRVRRDPALIGSSMLVHLQATTTASPTPPPSSTPTPPPFTAASADALSEATPTAIPRMALAQQETDRTPDITEDATKLDLQPAPPGDDTSSDLIAAPPSPASDDDTNPHVIALPPPPGPPVPPAPPAPTPRGPTTASSPGVPAAFADHHDDDDLSGPRTSVMTAAELDRAIPDRSSEVLPGHLSRRRVDFDPLDDGWGPPGTTIPPPLLGAIPGSEIEDDDEQSGAIPMPNIDSSPLMVGPSSLPPPGDPAGRSLARALEDTTSRAIEVIRELEHAQSRDQVVEIMISHLAETHHRAGFFVTRHATSKGAGELGLFAMMPRPAVMPFGTLRLDRPSTLQDVVGTRLPYRGPMHDDASRNFLVSTLGACPPEILLVPVAVRERVVGVLFGEHRHHHTFDDQVALAARAAGMALERILRTKRS